LLAQKVDPNAIVNSDGDFSKKIIRQLTEVAEQSKQRDEPHKTDENIETGNTVQDYQIVDEYNEPTQQIVSYFVPTSEQIDYSNRLLNEST
jgi:hypothetical protein